MEHNSSSRPKRPNVAQPATPTKPLANEQGAECRIAREDVPAFIPKIEMRDIFYQMIANELRNGRLTRSRRKRVIGYAAQLGLSAVEAGRLITTVREQVLESADRVERRYALKLVEPDPERVPVALKLASVVVLALVVDLLLCGWPL